MTNMNGNGISGNNLPAIICPSLLSCDLANLSNEGKNMIELGADWLHMDIMDGHFVNNLTFGPPIIEKLRQAIPDSYIDCHLMVTEPMKWITPLQKAGATSLTFHLESVMPDGGPDVVIEQIKNAGMKVGMVIKPGTPVEELYKYVDKLDLVLIMTVEPGFSGQKFMNNMMSKVKTLRTKYPNLYIQVDGGLSPDTIDTATDAGANVIVAASAIFGSNDRKGVIDTLRASVLKHQTQVS